MADYVYKYLKQTYRDKTTICYTDSIVYNVKPPDVYKDINEHWRQKFGTFNYSSDHTSGIK